MLNFLEIFLVFFSQIVRWIVNSAVALHHQGRSRMPVEQRWKSVLVNWKSKFHRNECSESNFTWRQTTATIFRASELRDPINIVCYYMYWWCSHLCNRRCIFARHVYLYLIYIEKRLHGLSMIKWLRTTFASVQYMNNFYFSKKGVCEIILRSQNERRRKDTETT